MNLRIIRRVLAKEVRETLRDRRTMLIMIVVPIFLYPVLLIFIQQLLLFGRQQLEEAPAAVTVVGGGAAADFLARDSALRVERAQHAPTAELREGEVDAVVELPATGAGSQGTVAARILYDASRDPSRRARDLVDTRLQEWGDSLLARRLEARGLPPSFASPLAVTDSSVASAERLGGYTLGRILPMLLIVITLLGAFYPAIDLTAGEKERGTLEPLLTTPVPAREIVAGKFLTVTLLALAAGALNLVSMLLTFESGVFQIAREQGIDFRLPIATVLLLLLLLLPLAVLFAAVFLGLAVRAQSFKEAQNTLTPVQLVGLVPTYLPLIPGIPFDYGLAVIPVGGMAVLFRELMSGTAPLGPSVAAVLSSVLYALVALRFATRAFGREEVLFGSGADRVSQEPLRARVASWRATMQGVPRPAAALAFVAAIGLLYFYIGGRMQIRDAERGLFASQWLLLALPAVLFAALGPYRVRSALALRPVSPRALAAAALIVLGGLPVSMLLSWLLSLVLEVPEEFMTGFAELLSADSPWHLLWLVLLIAVTPAVCEELVFRGILLQGLLRDMTMPRAVLLSAAIFGAYHLSFQTAIRFLPTAWLGLLFGYVVWRTRSLWAGVLMHLINNGSILLLVAWPGSQAYLVSPEGRPRGMLVPVSMLLLFLGFRLLPGRPALSPDEEADRRMASPEPASAP